MREGRCSRCNKPGWINWISCTSSSGENVTGEVCGECFKKLPLLRSKGIPGISIMKGRDKEGDEASPGQETAIRIQEDIDGEEE